MTDCARSKSNCLKGLQKITGSNFSFLKSEYNVEIVLLSGGSGRVPTELDYYQFIGGLLVMKKLVFNKRIDFSYVEGEILCITMGNKQDIIILVLDKKVTATYYYKIVHALKTGVFIVKIAVLNIYVKRA
ncbi:hypothetical protein [Bacillus toyonensis]|nr:hypothetical protein [Bacillus toyonensis]